MTYRSDKSEGPTAGTETADPQEFLGRVLTHIPDTGHVITRYYGWYAASSRRQLMREPPWHPKRHSEVGSRRLLVGGTS